MKIAYIILCHKNPGQINMLISELMKGDADVYIHFDKKNTKLKKRIIANDRVFLVSDDRSFAVEWGSNNIVRATLALIREVRNSGKKYDYVWLLSGQDFPIMNQYDIASKLLNDGRLNYIDIIDTGSKEYLRRKKLCEVWYPHWICRNNFFIKIIKLLYMFLTGGRYHTFSCFRRKCPLDSSFYFGSQWWCLRSDVAYRILNYCDVNNNCTQYFDNSIIPDECFFQTMFKHLLNNEVYCDSLTFVNWGNDRRSPSIITENDFLLLNSMSGRYCFARKFDTDVDSRIINRIKERLLCS